MFLFFFLFFGGASAAKDSYLEALEQSHGGPKKTDREYTEMYPYPAPQPPKPIYGPPSAPGPVYGPPSGPGPVYGPPSAPAPVYGPPVHNFGPPVPVYGPPAPAPIYGAPHAFLSILDKLKFKLDLFTIGKILLKIALFKKFVSFVGIICLLLFIPYLKKKVDDGVPQGGDDDDDEAMRGFGKKYRAGDKFLDNISGFVVGAIDNFSKKYPDDKCESVYCTTRKIVEKFDNKISYKKLADLYLKEVQQN